METKPSWDGNAPTFGEVLKEWEEQQNKKTMDNNKKNQVLSNALETILFETKEPIIKQYAQSALDEVVTKAHDEELNQKKLWNEVYQAVIDSDGGQHGTINHLQSNYLIIKK